MYDTFDMTKTSIENKLSEITEGWVKPTNANAKKMNDSQQWDPR